MKWYLVVHNDAAVEDPLVADDEDLGGFEDRHFLQGAAIEGWSDSSYMRARTPGNDGVPDDALQNRLHLLVFSQRLQRAMKAAAINGMQFLPVEVRNSSGLSMGRFSVVNVTQRRAVFHQALSALDRFPPDDFIPDRRGRVRAVRRAVLDGSQLAGIDIVRPDEYPFEEYVSDAFVSVFAAGHFTGLGFLPVNVA